MRVRPARTEDVPALERLIAASARALGEGYYTAAETEAAIAHVFGVDSKLVADGTYLVAEDDAGTLLGSGGWSRRRTLFGGDRFAGREAGLLDPAREAARIRAFFVGPDAARRGVGAALLAACEDAALAAGFAEAALMATLPGVPFYAARGYVATDATTVDAGGVPLRFVAMNKRLLHR